VAIVVYAGVLLYKGYTATGITVFIGAIICFTLNFLSIDAQITEHDRVVIPGGWAVDIHSITSLREDDKKRIELSYSLPERERQCRARIREADKKRFIADLLAINPNIRVDTSTPRS
jgi:hypothetical protein